MLAERAVEAKDGKRAVDEASRALAVAPHSVAARLALGDGHALLGDDASARAAYRLAIDDWHTYKAVGVPEARLRSVEASLASPTASAKSDTVRPAGRTKRDRVSVASSKPDPHHGHGSGDQLASRDTARCDEVSCTLSNYDGACCAKYRRASGTAGSSPSGNADLPEALDRTAISEAMAKVKSKLFACGDKTSTKGTVKLSVKVGAAGSVVDASADTTDAASAPAS